MIGNPPGIINREDAPPIITNNNNRKYKSKEKERNRGTTIRTSEKKTEEETKVEITPTYVFAPTRETTTPPKP